MSEYLSTIRNAWISAMTTEGPDNYYDAITEEQAVYAWDAAIAAHDREVKAEAWDEGYIRGRHPWTGVDQEDDPIPPCTAPPTWGRNANPYRIETEEAP